MPTPDQGKIYAQITQLGNGNSESLFIKHLSGKIMELIVKNYRFVFFTKTDLVYFVSAFIKKTNKTPKQEIDLAKKIYQVFN